MNPIVFLFHKRIRGFRIVDLGGFGCLTVLVLGVYFSKAHAGGETARIGDVDQQIVEEQRRVRLMQAEIAHLEEPGRIERLSVQYLGLSPISPKRETPDGSLMEIARQASEPAPAVKPGAVPPTSPKPGAGKVTKASLPLAPPPATFAAGAPQ